MANTLINSAKVSAAATASTSSIDTTGSSQLFATLSFASGFDVYFTSLTDNKGNTFTKRSSAASGTICWLFACENATVGTGHTCTLTTSAVMFYTLVFAGFSSPTALTFDLQSSANAGSPPVSPGSITPSAANSLVIAGCSGPDGSTGTASLPTGFTLVDQGAYVGGAGEPGGMWYEDQTTATARNPSFTGWSGGGGGEAACIISMIPSGGAAATPWQSLVQDNQPLPDIRRAVAI